MGIRKRKIILPAGVVGGLALLIAWIMTHLGNGAGSGNGATVPSSQPPNPSAQTQPGAAMQVVISGDRYLVEGKEATADQVVAMAQNASSVRIVSNPDSRMGAKLELEKAMDNAHLAYTLESSPVPGQ